MKKILAHIFIATLLLSTSIVAFAPRTAEAHCNPTLENAIKSATVGGDTFSLVDCIAIGTSYVVTPVLGKILQITGSMLDYSISWTLQLSNFVKTIPAIEIAWKIIRDFTTMVFIFLLLYQGISMVLGLGTSSAKTLITSIVISGLLINFSFFFTSVMIDASNVVAKHFYDAIGVNKNCKTYQLCDGELSQIFMNQLRIQTIFDNTAVAGNGISDTKIVPGHNIIVLVMGAILMLIASFTFFAAALLFLIRSATLIFLLTLSPFAFIFGGILPKTGQAAASISNKWWPTLVSQLTFAPVYLLLVYIGMKIMESTGWQVAINSSQASLATALTGAGSIGVFFNFAIVIMFFIFALIVAKGSGTMFAGKIIGWGDSLRKWGQGAVTGFAGRNTLGLAARHVAETETFKNLAARNPNLGLVANAGLNKVAGAAFGGTKGGYDAEIKKKTKARVDMGKKMFDKAASDEAKAASLAESLAAATSTRNTDMSQANEMARNAERKLDLTRRAVSRKAAEDLKKAAQDKFDAAEKAANKTAEESGKAAGQERQNKYADQVKRGWFAAGSFGGVPSRWRRDAADAIRKDMKKSKTDRALDALKEFTKPDDDDKPKEDKPKDKDKDK